MGNYIRLTKTIPVDRKYGLTVGKILEVLSRKKGGRGERGYWIEVGEPPEKVLVWDAECEVVGVAPAADPAPGDKNEKEKTCNT